MLAGKKPAKEKREKRHDQEKDRGRGIARSSKIAGGCDWPRPPEVSYPILTSLRIRVRPLYVDPYVACLSYPRYFAPFAFHPLSILYVLHVTRRGNVIVALARSRQLFQNFNVKAGFPNYAMHATPTQRTQRNECNERNSISIASSNQYRN